MWTEQRFKKGRTAGRALADALLKPLRFLEKTLRQHLKIVAFLAILFLIRTWGGQYMRIVTSQYNPRPDIAALDVLDSGTTEDDRALPVQRLLIKDHRQRLERLQHWEHSDQAASHNLLLESLKRQDALRRMTDEQKLQLQHQNEPQARREIGDNTTKVTNSATLFPQTVRQITGRSTPPTPKPTSWQPKFNGLPTCNYPLTKLNDVWRNSDKLVIAIATCTRSGENWKSKHETALEKYLLPSLVRTISENDLKVFDVWLYMCIDEDDEYWHRNSHSIITPTWLTMKWISYPKTGRIPFNEVCHDAYLDGADYIVRINDDSEFTTNCWMANGVSALLDFSPPNVGVVGPTCKEGNVMILTHDMVHRTHLDIFEHYYPPEFKNWYLDDWMTLVYKPDRMVKLKTWSMTHHVHFHGTRYTVAEARHILQPAVTRDQATIRAYLEQHASLLARGGGQPGPVVALPICLCITVPAPSSLAAGILLSYMTLRLPQSAAETYVWFQNITTYAHLLWAQRLVDPYRLELTEVYYTKSNIDSQGTDLLTSRCGQRYILPLGVDFVPSLHIDTETVQRGFRDALSLLKAGKKAVRLRSRKTPGWGDQTTAGNIPDSSLCQQTPPAWCSSSTEVGFTSDPTVYTLQFYMSLVARDSALSEAPVLPGLAIATTWGRQKLFEVAQTEGLFTFAGSGAALQLPPSSMLIMSVAGTIKEAIYLYAQLRSRYFGVLLAKVSMALSKLQGTKWLVTGWAAYNVARYGSWDYITDDFVDVEGLRAALTVQHVVKDTVWGTASSRMDTCSRVMSALSKAFEGTHPNEVITAMNDECQLRWETHDEGLAVLNGRFGDHPLLRVVVEPVIEGSGHLCDVNKARCFPTQGALPGRRVDVPGCPRPVHIPHNLNDYWVAVDPGHTSCLALPQGLIEASALQSDSHSLVQRAVSAARQPSDMPCVALEELYVTAEARAGREVTNLLWAWMSPHCQQQDRWRRACAHIMAPALGGPLAELSTSSASSSRAPLYSPGSGRLSKVVMAAIGNSTILQMEQEFLAYVLPLRKVYSEAIVLLIKEGSGHLMAGLMQLAVAHSVTPKMLSGDGEIELYAAYADVCSGYQRCFASRLGATVFQDNPFRDDTIAADLVFSQSADGAGTIKDAPWFSDVSACWGPTAADRLMREGRRALRAEAITGSPAGFEALSAQMARTRSSKSCEGAATLNHAVHAEGMPPTMVIVVEAPGTRLAVLQTGPGSWAASNEHMLYTRPDGPVVAVVCDGDGTQAAALTALTARLLERSPSVPWRWVVSYSLYGSSNRYTANALHNANAFAAVYPGWEMWVYHNRQVPQDTLEQLTVHPFVRLIDGDALDITAAMSWRFLVASDDTVARYAIRDIDSHIGVREKAAVDEWVASGRLFHVMRDHPSHGNYAMSGGMWGGTHAAYRQMKAELTKRAVGNEYMDDMNFLNGLVWATAKRSVLQHDAFSCKRYGGKGFPLPRTGWEHIGGVYIDGKLREGDVRLLADAVTRKDDPCPRPDLTAVAHAAGTDGGSTASKKNDVVVDKDAVLRRQTLVFHRTARQRLFDRDSYDSIRSQCALLDGRNFVECSAGQEGSEWWVRQHQPCADHAFIAKISDAYIGDDSYSADVPGTVFTDKRTFLWQPYIGPVPAGPPSAWPPSAKPMQLHRYECLASVLQAHPSDPEYFPVEGLPRLVYLLRHVPVHCAVVVATSPAVDAYLSLLPGAAASRIVKWPGKGHLYFAHDVYTVNEAPYCQPVGSQGGSGSPTSTSLRSGGGSGSTFFQPEVLQQVRGLLAWRMAISNFTGRVAVVVTDGYQQAGDLVVLLQSSGAFADVRAVSAADNVTLVDRLLAFHAANVVVGVTGNLLAGVLFARPGTRFVEVGFDGTRVRALTSTYARVAAALQLEYRLVVGQGDFGGQVALDPHRIIDLLPTKVAT